MMNFLNNMNLLPKNFIVANIVEVLKEDPDNGVEKLYEMSGTFITDSQIKAISGQIKGYYDSHPSIKRYVKNMIYNTNKTCLNQLKNYGRGFLSENKCHKNIQLMSLTRSLSILG